MKMHYLAAAAAVFGCTTASAATLADLAKEVTASGWISGSYAYNFNDSDGLIQGRVADVQADSFVLNQAVLNLSSAPTEGFGGTVMLLAGEDAANVINPSYGDTDDKLAVQQAYLSYAAGDLTVIAGRYNSLAGYEVLADPSNTTLSRSLVYINAQPYFHTGVRAAYKASDAATLFLGLANSAALGASVDANDPKTIEVGGLFTLSPAVTVGIYDYFGVEAGDTGKNTNYLDFVGTLTATDTLSFAINADYFSQEDTVDVVGVAGYATQKLNDMWSATVRLENVNIEPDAGSDLTINEATLALTYAPASNFKMFFEGRVDDADADIYIDGTDFTGTQPTLGVKAIYTFGM